MLVGRTLCRVMFMFGATRKAMVRGDGGCNRCGGDDRCGHLQVDVVSYRWRNKLNLGERKRFEIM